MIKKQQELGNAYTIIGDSMFSMKDAEQAAAMLNIDFSKFSKEDFLTGLNIELEHGKISLATNVTNDDLEKTAKIALAHLNEFPNYYNQEYGLPALEESLKKKNQSIRSFPSWLKEYR